MADCPPAIAALCQSLGIPPPEPEVRFHQTRRWRFDWAWVAGRVAVEIQGGVWSRGRHTRGRGYLNDREKVNTAQLLGWVVLEVTPTQWADGSALAMVAEALRRTTPEAPR